MMMSSSSSPSPSTTFFVPGSARPSIWHKKVTRALLHLARAPSESAHLADEAPFVIGHGLHRKPRIFYQHHRGELRLGLDRRKRHRLRHVLHRLHIDEA